MLIALIPTMDVAGSLPLVRSILNCKDRPEETYIINNGKRVGEQVIKDVQSGICLIQFDKNIGVNASWNVGLNIAEDKKAHLSILNDDIQIKYTFFSRIRKLLRTDNHTPVFCPSTIHDLDKFFNLPSFSTAPSSITTMRRKEGWAFTIRDSYVKKIPAIPKELFTFCGDDWIWDHTVSYGGRWIKDISNVIYHRIGKTLRQMPELRSRLREEKQIYKRIKQKGKHSWEE